jgi:hypothetical protein
VAEGDGIKSSRINGCSFIIHGFFKEGDYNFKWRVAKGPKSRISRFSESFSKKLPIKGGNGHTCGGNLGLI